MRTRALVLLGPAALLVLFGCDSNRAVDISWNDAGSQPSVQASRAHSQSTQFATLITLPTLSGRNAEAFAVNNAGTVIAGYANERNGGTRAVKWTLQADGSWTITALPHSASATSANARGINRAGDIVGGDYAGSFSNALLWPAAGGFTTLGCGDRADAYAISADGQIVVGWRRGVVSGTAAVWRPVSCTEELPLLQVGGWSRAHAVSGDGTIVGGAGAATISGDALPLRWVQVAGTYQIEQLDSRSGYVIATNAAGDLAGAVRVPCALSDGCSRAMIWYAGGGSRELGTLGGSESWVRGINAAGEVVGGSTGTNGINTAYFWSESLGMVQLPIKGRWAAAHGISDPRPDGTRLVVGSTSAGQPIMWMVVSP